MPLLSQLILMLPIIEPGITRVQHHNKPYRIATVLAMDEQGVVVESAVKGLIDGAVAPETITWRWGTFVVLSFGDEDDAIFLDGVGEEWGTMDEDGESD